MLKTLRKGDGEEPGGAGIVGVGETVAGPKVGGERQSRSVRRRAEWRPKGRGGGNCVGR